MSSPVSKWMGYGRGIVAIVRLALDYQDPRRFVTATHAFEGETAQYVYRRFRSCEDGRRLLRDKPDMFALLKDRDALARLPENSLGRAYLEHCQRTGISADGAKEAVDEAGYHVLAGLADDDQFVFRWLRDTHDLHHVVTGYDVDLLGELFAFAFIGTQLENRGILLVVRLAAAAAAVMFPWSRPLYSHAKRRARSAEFFPTVNWAAALGEDLEELRARLRLDPPPAYRRVYEPPWGPIVKRIRERHIRR